jgi:uncharacterized protein with PIN domain
VLTTSRRREKLLKKLRLNYLILPNGEDWMTQLCLVLRHFNLQPVLKLNFCPRCLGELRPASPREVEEKVPLHSRRCGKDFKVCPECGAVYWIGGHKRLMEETLRRLEERCGQLFGI